MFGLRGLREELEELKETNRCLCERILGFDEVIGDESAFKKLQRLDEMIRMMKGAVQSVEAERMTLNAMRAQMAADRKEQIEFLAKMQKSLEKLKEKKKKKKVKDIDGKNNNQ